MSRRIPCPSTPLSCALFVGILLFSGTVAFAPGAWADDANDTGFSIQDRRPQIDPEYGVPGDDDQPTVSSRKKREERITSAPTGTPTTGNEPSVARAESSGIAKWGAILRTSVLRLGMMLR